MTLSECEATAKHGDCFFNEITGKLMRFMRAGCFEVLIGEYNGAESACNLLFNREQCDAEWQRMDADEATCRTAAAKADSGVAEADTQA